MNKKKLTEQDIRTKFITPAIVETAGWDRMKQLREEVFFTDGRIWVRGNMAKRGKRKKADYILYYKPHIPLAVVEAKDNTHSPNSGMEQALEYAEILDIPFVYTCNGDSFVEHDRTVTAGPKEKDILLDAFPTPEHLWKRYKAYKGITDDQEKIIARDYYRLDVDKVPRYYQITAINRTIEAIAKGQNRLLLVMATGTGKTFTAFQIIWRLWKAGAKKRILFLADRNILVDQTKSNDFKPFAGKMHKITGRKPEKSYEIFLALYQAITGTEEHQKIYKEYSPDFFDLIVVDECHRGSAADDSAWREILEYFSGAAQLGMTATPKETQYVSNISYFGSPLYTYSLAQGIADGFLAPYKVIRLVMDKDDGWRPPVGTTDKYGDPVPDRIYNLNDYERELVLTQRCINVAKRVSEFLRNTDPYAKTIIFCVDIEHAERMRKAMVNENPDLVAENYKYVMQITGDNPIGKMELDNFIMPAERYPVVAVTSKLMSTGVDAKTCKLIVIEKNINSMTEFKQIIGRGTRVEEDYGKMFFTIMDFRRATNLFADPDFDGDPVCIYEPGTDDPVVEPEDLVIDETWLPEEDGAEENENDETTPYGVPCTAEGYIGDHHGAGGKRRKYHVDGVPVDIVNERVQYLDGDGKLITESIRSYCKKRILKEFSTLDDFLKSWSGAERKKVILEELVERGVFLEQMQEEVGPDFGAFDLICHVAFDRKPLTRKERADNVKKRNYFEKYGQSARAVLEALLQKYADSGAVNIEDMNILKIQPFKGMGTLMEIMKSFGGKKHYLSALKELQDQLYETA
ncbi:MAG: DEAD/DEAH box helicase family protein [bacterium]|nr:DEAD/DEAH box helicase family protein [bacterium]